MKLTLTGFVLFLAASAGCATVAVPEAQMASSEGAIRGAREVGAERVPAASLHLRLAEEEMTKAKAKMAEGDNAAAALLLERSRADAELALSLTREAAAVAEATAVVTRVEQVRSK